MEVVVVGAQGIGVAGGQEGQQQEEQQEEEQQEEQQEEQRQRQRQQQQRRLDRQQRHDQVSSLPLPLHTPPRSLWMRRKADRRLVARSGTAATTMHTAAGRRAAGLDVLESIMQVPEEFDDMRFQV